MNLREFLKLHQEECITCTVFAAFGMKNHAEREGLALLKEYNALPGEMKKDCVISKITTLSEFS